MFCLRLMESLLRENISTEDPIPGEVETGVVYSGSKKGGILRTVRSGCGEGVGCVWIVTFIA